MNHEKTTRMEKLQNPLNELLFLICNLNDSSTSFDSEKKKKTTLRSFRTEGRHKPSVDSPERTVKGQPEQRSRLGPDHKEETGSGAGEMIT